MIHFFPTFSKGARQSPFAQELDHLEVNYRMFPGEINLRYHARIWLFLVGWPKLFYFAFKSAWHSLFVERPHPRSVVVGSHIEATVFCIFRIFLLKRYQPNIVLLGFIYTSRKNPFIGWMKERYFTGLFSIIDMVICHSSLEVARYEALFRHAHASFRYVPYGLHVAGRHEVFTDIVAERQTPYVLTAGRSGRDYDTLFKAMKDLDVDLHVVCDSELPLTGLKPSKNVSVLRNCYGTDYIKELSHALFVVVPLDVADISAGQMVLIQAMALSKATIVTRTPTIEEYITDGKESLLVEQGNVNSLKNAIVRLVNEPEFTYSLGREGLMTYEARYSMKAYVHGIVGSILAFQKM